MESKLMSKKETKICSICKEEKLISEFHKDSRGVSGVRADCKVCRNLKPENKKSRKGIRNCSEEPRNCTLCGIEFIPTGNRQLYCVECSKEIDRKNCREYRARTYVKKGREHLKGKNANGHKSGLGLYMELAKMPNAQCERCGSTKFLLVHHKDRNRDNNNINNLEVLCKSCHQAEHIIRDSNGRFHSSV